MLGAGLTHHDGTFRVLVFVHGQKRNLQTVSVRKRQMSACSMGVGVRTYFRRAMTRRGAVFMLGHNTYLADGAAGRKLNAKRLDVGGVCAGDDVGEGAIDVAGRVYVLMYLSMGLAEGCYGGSSTELIRRG